MDFRISLLLFLCASAGYGGENFDHYDNENVLKSCRKDGNCSTGKFCSERGKCVDCYKCSDYKREDVGPEVRRSCAKSASDCGKCLPGYKLERCADNKYCDKCIRTRPSTQLPGSNIGKLEDRGPPLFSNNNINIGNVENTSNWSVPLAAGGPVSVLLIIVFARQFIRKVLKKIADAILPTHEDVRESSGPLLALVASNDPEVTEPVQDTMNQVRIQSENLQQAQRFNPPRKEYEAPARPTAPPLIISDDTDGLSSGGSTAPSNWEPSRFVDNSPVQQEEQEAPGSTMEEAGDSNPVAQCIRQNMTAAVSESSVFSARDGPVEAPESFLYRSVDELCTSQIPRTSSLTVFNPPVYPSRRTLDSGFDTYSLSTQSDFSADDAIEMDDDAIEMDLAVVVRVPPSE